LKGVLREQCEHVCEFYEVDGPQRRRVPGPHDAFAVLAEFGGSPPLITRTFGSQLAPCGLLFSDARLTRQALQHYAGVQTSTLTQVRIDRVYRTAVDEALFTSQFGIPDLTFEGTIIGQLGTAPMPDLAREASDYDEEEYTFTPSFALLLLLAGLPLVERMGGNKSSGKGACQYRVKRLTLDRHECPEEIRQDWLGHTDALSTYHLPEKGA